MIEHLEPRPLWNYFQQLNAVPRPSKHEERIIAFMLDFARQHGLWAERDEVGNVLMRKPASPGREDRPTVALQSHLDMVHQKNANTRFDFSSEGIRMRAEGDWVVAEGTTLGADNGIGVAAAMAVLTDPSLQHPPLEALFTIDEETGMTGAKGLRAGWLEAKVLLNLDTEDDRELTIGCAGGVDVLATLAYQPESPGPEAKFFEVQVNGLTGGHSGMDIHRGRANANKVMNRLLFALAPLGMRLARLDGGGLRNAIPRESSALIALPSAHLSQAEAVLGECLNQCKSEFASTDPHLNIGFAPHSESLACLPQEFQDRLLRAIYALPNGIYRLCPEVAGLVQTSNNLARVIIQDGSCSVQCLCRGSLDSEKLDMAHAIGASLELMGAQVEFKGGYPGWQPQPGSRIVQLMSDLYREMFASEPEVKACHAGLECGIVGQNYPHTEMISFGPNIHGAHSPDERVQISSVAKFWRFLSATLERL